MVQIRAARASCHRSQTCGVPVRTDTRLVLSNEPAGRRVDCTMWPSRTVWSCQQVPHGYRHKARACLNGPRACRVAGHMAAICRTAPLTCMLVAAALAGALTVAAPAGAGGAHSVHRHRCAGTVHAHSAIVRSYAGHIRAEQPRSGSALSCPAARATVHAFLVANLRWFRGCAIRSNGRGCMVRTQHRRWRCVIRGVGTGRCTAGDGTRVRFTLHERSTG